MGRERRFEVGASSAGRVRRLTAGEIVDGMRVGAVRYGQLTGEAREAVDAEVRRQRAGRPPPDMAARGARMLSAVRAIVRQGPAGGGKPRAEPSGATPVAARQGWLPP